MSTVLDTLASTLQDTREVKKGLVVDEVVGGIHNGLIWVFPKKVVPPNHPFYRVFHYKPSIWGYPYFWKHPYTLYLSISKCYGILICLFILFYFFIHTFVFIHSLWCTLWLFLSDPLTANNQICCAILEGFLIDFTIALLRWMMQHIQSTSNSVDYD